MAHPQRPKLPDKVNIHDRHNTDVIPRNNTPLDDNQKQIQAAAGLADITFHVNQIQEWLEWDAVCMDSQIINNLPTTTIEMISSIQDLIKMYHDDEEMKDGEHDDTTCGHDSTNRSGITKENENLTETVRNMSRTNIILAEENRELKSLLTSSARPQPPTPGIGLEGSIHAPTPHATITKSATPVPITPPRKDRTPTKNTIPPRS